nr:MAG TPA: ParB protein [Bacteriophage sp.]
MDNKYFTSEIVEIKRSQIHPAVYNPRKISKEGKAALKRSIKNFGVLGGIVINRRTNNTIISGHQKVDILDILNDYPEKDYALRVEVVDYDEKKGERGELCPQLT